MTQFRSIAPVVALALTAPAVAQSDPAGFGTVYNIGTVTPGSIFDINSADIPGAVVNASQVGDNDPFTVSDLFPFFLQGDVLTSNSQLNLFDNGQVLPFFSVGRGNNLNTNVEFNAFGGSVGDNLLVHGFSTMNVFGGTIGNGIRIDRDSTVNVFGGTIGNFQARSGSTVNLVGTSFILDGVELTGLTAGDAFTITDRDVTLTAVLFDGSSLELDVGTGGTYSFLPGSTLTVTLVPAPTSAAALAMGGLLAARRRR